MATVQDFEAVKKHQEWTWTLDEYDQHLEEWFPDEEDRLAYGRWSMEKGKEEHNRMRYDREDWGYLKLEEDVKQQQFSCARIANRLSDLELFKPFSMTEIVNHPVEIVYAVTTAQRTMIRATIASL